MTFWQSLGGMMEMELISADPFGTLKAAGERGIPLFHTAVQNDLTVTFLIERKDSESMQKLCQKRGDRLNCLQKLGNYWLLIGLFHRPMLAAGIVLLLLTACFLPTRILFVSVEGNNRVEAARILEAAENNGLFFFAPRREIRSEKIKNALLSEIPALSWAGVNTFGCRGVISVEERMEPTEPEDRSAASIVAVVDGVILRCTAQQGNLLCKPGQAVQRGEVLISGYTDCGLCIRLTRAQGEVYAQTSREVTAAAPAEYQIPVRVKSVKRNYSLLLGKKRINFWNNSRIWNSSCGRIYKEYHLCLPGNLRLPLAAVVEEVVTYELSFGEDNPERMLRQYAEQYLLSHVAAGEIIKKHEHFTQEDGILCLSAQYTCREMIGRVRPEQIGEYHGQTG